MKASSLGKLGVFVALAAIVCAFACPVFTAAQEPCACGNSPVSASATNERSVFAAPFTIVRKFPLTIGVKVELPKEVGGDVLTLKGRGKLVLEFEPTFDRNIYIIKMLHNEMTIAPFRVALPSGEQLEVEELRFRQEHFQLTEARGKLDISNNKAVLVFGIRMTPADFPALKRFGFDGPLQFTIRDTGTIDLDKGSLQLTPDRTAIEVPKLGGLTLHFFDIEENCLFGQARLCVTLDPKPPALMDFDCQKEVYICAGETAYLHYSAKNVASATITGVGTVATPSASVPVQPQSDTTYTLELSDENGCTDTSEAFVRVVTSGRTWTISANPNTSVGTNTSGKWTAKVDIFSDKVLTTSIKFVNCNPYWPDDAAPVTWHCDKVNRDGTGQSFDLTSNQSTPWGTRSVPVAGSWEFFPKLAGYVPRGTACFEVTMTCK